MDCIFCQIIDRKIPADIVYEDDAMLVFKDIKPVAPVHCLIVPKIHIPTFSDCSEEHAPLLGRMMAMVPQLAAKLGCGLTGPAGEHHDQRSGGYKTLINTGPDGGQVVYHLHIHLIGGPRPWPGKH